MQKKKRILLKVGSNTLTKETDNISRGKIEDIANQIAKLQDTCEFIIVSSGAIAVAKQFVKLESKEKDVFVKQALASIGQPHLIRIYQEIFREYGLLTSQCLLSYSDFEKQQSKTNIVNTINVLVQNNYIPIINENDTVATDEIQFGDNDKLGALTASLLEVDLFIIATNTNGIYTKASIESELPKTIKEVSDFEILEKQVVNSKSSHGSGGMQSKIEAASVTKKANIETWIVNGLEDNFIINAFENQIPFTKIKSSTMKNYTSINDIDNINSWIKEAKELKANPLENIELGKNKTLGLLFFNSSLRTRLSTQKAALNLGMNPIVMNVSGDAWGIEFGDGTVMNGNTAEHIKEAASVVSQYCDIIAVRAFPTLKDKVKDESEQVLNAFKKYASVPIVNMESATGHPLQGLTDALTISEHAKVAKPKVVLSWAPHIKALPHAVANSFVQAMQKMDVDFVITNPEGYNLNPDIIGNTSIIHNQKEAFKNADFVYTKNWSSYEDYGKVVNTDPNWMITKAKIGDAKFMHCLPVRRNVVVEDAVLDSDNSLVIQQANNRTYAAQLVLKKILENL